MANFRFAHSRCSWRSWFVPSLAAFSLFFSGCANQAETASEAQSGPQDDQTPRCEIGKCDGLTGEIKDYYTDMRSLSLDDLAGLGVGYTTDALNDALALIPYVDLELEPTSFFGLSERALFGEVTVESLSQLQAGLTERLGETAFATRVNAIRQKSLQAGYGEVFAESLFRIKGELSHQLEMDAGDTVGTVGFNANPTLEAMVIAPVAGELEGIWRGPLEAVRASRGFILPRSRQDIEAMVPGSSIALRGEGSLALNLGLGLPIYVAGLGSHLTLTARISAGARAGLKGRLDVQLIRGEGDEVFVDVGLSSASIRHYELALSSGWGVEGLPIVELDLGPLTVDLSELLSRSIEKQLNAHLSPFDLRSSEGREESRLSVARFRLELSAGVEAEQALAQALRGDIRLAQALANRPKSGVEQLVDLTRDVQSESDYMGFRFLSMRFFKNELERRGVVHVSENGEGQTLLFNELSSESGFFFTNRGVAWRRLTELKSRNGQLISAQNNARLTLSEADRFLSKDQVLDHIDPLLCWFIGQDQILDTLSPTADGLFYYADHHCGRPPSRDPDNRREREAYERCV
ncbi:MAG: hypothetical protein VYD19_06215, partial [Myxococcota bacterium]|nr:hypothetical protein [Myxococcota bacterium]